MPNIGCAQFFTQLIRNHGLYTASKSVNFLNFKNFLFKHVIPWKHRLFWECALKNPWKTLESVSLQHLEDRCLKKFRFELSEVWSQSLAQNQSIGIETQFSWKSMQNFVQWKNFYHQQVRKWPDLFFSQKIGPLASYQTFTTGKMTLSDLHQFVISVNTKFV